MQLNYAEQMDARESSLFINDKYNSGKVAESLHYCIKNPNDIAPLAVNLNYFKESANLPEYAVLKYLAGNHGVIFSSEQKEQIATPDNSLYLLKNLYSDSTKIYIGVNHTGSWSTIESVKPLLDSPLFVVNDYTTATSDKIPPLESQLKYLKKDIELHCSTPPRFIYSHLGMPIHQVLPMTPFEYFTMVRNPVSRFISVYYWTFKHRHADVHWVPDIIKQGATLEQYVDYYLANNMYPGGLDPCCYFYNAWKDLGFIPPEVSNDILASAMHVLNKYFTFVGVTELYDESLFILAGFLGLKKLPLWKFFGSSGRPSLEDINPRIIRKIDSITQIDNELYIHMREKFEKEFNFEIAYFRKKIGSLCTDDKYIEAPNML